MGIKVYKKKNIIKISLFLILFDKSSEFFKCAELTEPTIRYSDYCNCSSNFMSGAANSKDCCIGMLMSSVFL